MSHYEVQVEEACVNWATAHGWRNVKLDTARNAKGAPDRLFIGPEGKSLYIEFKRCGEELRGLSPLQKGWKRWLEDNGHAYYTCSSLDSFLTFVRYTYGLSQERDAPEYIESRLRVTSIFG